MRICKKTLKQRGKDADAMKIDETFFENRKHCITD
jgi:hypothetical protein